MRNPDPMEYVWWLSSRAAGVVAFLLVALSVLIGLAMANRLVRGRTVMKPLRRGADGAPRAPADAGDLSCRPAAGRSRRRGRP